MKNKLSASELSFFCMEVAMILKSGILIADGINSLYDDLEDGNVKDVIGILKKELSIKNYLYEAMEKTNCFPAYLVNMCHIGSITGKLEEVLTSLSDYYDREDALRNKIRSAVFYPTVLFIIMSCVIILLVTQIFPIFQRMINELGGEISAGTSVFMSFSTGIMVGKATMYIIIIIIAFIIVFSLFWRIDKGKIIINNLLNKFILTRNIRRKITAYRFASSMSLMLSSGMNIDKSYDLLLQITEDKDLKNKMVECKNLIEDGSSFADAVSKLSIFSNLHLNMINMGMRVGELDLVMNKLTNIYENEAEESINKFVSLIEPVLVSILSIAIGAILISVMMPLMNIMSSI